MHLSWFQASKKKCRTPRDTERHAHNHFGSFGIDTLFGSDTVKEKKKIIQRLYCARGKSGFNNLFSFCFGLERLRNLNEMLSYKICSWFQNNSIMLHMKCVQVMQISREDLFQWPSVLQIAWISWLRIDTKKMWVIVSSLAVSSHRLFLSLSPSSSWFYAVFVSRFLMQFTTSWVGGKWIE